MYVYICIHPRLFPAPANDDVSFRLRNFFNAEVLPVAAPGFGAPSAKTVGIHDKISAARDPSDNRPLPEKITRKMRKLVTIRNALVHDRDVNAIADRPAFVQDWNEVEAALKAMVPQAGSSCAVS